MSLYASVTLYTSLSLIYEGKPFLGFNGAMERLGSNQTANLRSLFRLVYKGM